MYLGGTTRGDRGARSGATSRAKTGSGTVVQSARGAWLFLPVFIVAAGLALHVLDLGGLASRIQDLSLARLEAAVRPNSPPVAHRPATVPPVRYVDIDRQSLAALGPWPWPRSDIARLVAGIGQAGATLVVLDLALSGPDPVAPQRIVPLLPQDADGTAVAAALNLLPNTDIALAQAMGTVPVVTRLELSGAEAGTALPGSPIATDAHGLRWLPDSRGATGPFASLAQASVGWGAELPLTAGEAIYRLPFAVQIDHVVRPTLLLESARIALGQRDAKLELFAPATVAERWLGRPGFSSVRFGQMQVPVTRSAALMFNPAVSDIRAIPAEQILNGQALKELSGAVVVVGASAATGARPVINPLGVPVASTALLAAGLDQTLKGQFITRPVWADGGEEIFLLLVGLALCLLFAYAPVYWPLLIGLAACGGTGYLSWLAFEREAWFIDAALPNLVIGVTLLAGLYARGKAARAAEDATRAAAFSALGITPTMGSFLAPRPASVGNKGELRTLTVMVCDIRGFEDVLTRYHDTPAALTRLIGRFQEVMTEVVHKNKGLVATYYGARIVAYWNASGTDTEHASNACNCALRMIDALQRLNDEFSDDAKQDLVPFEAVSVSIGLETGPCVVSLAKEGGRPELVTVGETVAVAELLARRADSYGPAAIVGSSAQVDAQKLFALLEIDCLRLPHRPEPVQVFALLGNPLVKASPRFRALDATHKEIFAAYRAQNWQLARALVQECRKLPAAASKLYDLYDRRITNFERTPPPEGWDGAHDLIAS